MDGTCLFLTDITVAVAPPYSRILVFLVGIVLLAFSPPGSNAKEGKLSHNCSRAIIRGASPSTLTT